MIFDFITHIKDNILTNNPNTFQSGFTTAVKLQNGKIVTVDAREFVYSGLKDTEYNYFYIRTFENITLDAASDERTTSCYEYTGTAPLRLVAWVNNGNASLLTEVLMQDVMNTDFDTMTQAQKQRFSNWGLTFDTIVYDREEIYKDETNGEDEDVKLPKGVVIMALDFTFSFNYKTKAREISSCLDRSICVGCTS